MRDDSDQELIAKLVRGENLALNELMGRYKQRLFHFIRRYAGDEETAYDILQETFTKLYFNADTYRPQYKVSTWMFQIALNLCRDHARKHRHGKPLSTDDESLGLHETLAAFTHDQVDIISAQRDLAIVQRAIERLPHKLKSALILFAIEEHSQQECAELLGITPKAVEARVYRARKILADALTQAQRRPPTHSTEIRKRANG